MARLQEEHRSGAMEISAPNVCSRDGTVADKNYCKHRTKRFCLRPHGKQSVQRRRSVGGKILFVPLCDEDVAQWMRDRQADMQDATSAGNTHELARLCQIVVSAANQLYKKSSPSTVANVINGDTLSMRSADQVWIAWEKRPTQDPVCGDVAEWSQVRIRRVISLFCWTVWRTQHGANRRRRRHHTGVVHVARHREFSVRCVDVGSPSVTQTPTTLPGVRASAGEAPDFGHGASSSTVPILRGIVRKEPRIWAFASCFSCCRGFFFSDLF